MQEWLKANAPQWAAMQVDVTEPLCDMAGALWEIEGKRLAYTPGHWLHRNAANVSCSVVPAIIRGQIEQGLLSPAGPLLGQHPDDMDISKPMIRDVIPRSAMAPEDIRRGYTWERMPQGYEIPEDHPWPGANPIGVRFYRDTHNGQPGIVRMTGDRRQSSCFGFGIPDPGASCPWSLTIYGPWKVPLFGFASQCVHFYWFLRKQLDSWKPDDVAMLYATDEEKSAAAAEGRKPKGEIIRCGNPFVKWAMKYTPTEAGMTTMQGMAEKRGWA